MKGGNVGGYGGINISSPSDAAEGILGAQEQEEVSKLENIFAIFISHLAYISYPGTRTENMEAASLDWILVSLQAQYIWLYRR